MCMCVFLCVLRMLYSDRENEFIEKKIAVLISCVCVSVCVSACVRADVCVSLCLCVCVSCEFCFMMAEMNFKKRKSVV